MLICDTCHRPTKIRQIYRPQLNPALVVITFACERCKHDWSISFETCDTYNDLGNTSDAIISGEHKARLHAGCGE